MPPLFIDFDCRFWTYLKAVSTTSAFTGIGYFCWVIAVGIYPVWREYQNVHWANIIAAQPTALANFLQNFYLRH
jgi:hypothetical protein